MTSMSPGPKGASRSRKPSAKPKRVTRRRLFCRSAAPMSLTARQARQVSTASQRIWSQIMSNLGNSPSAQANDLSQARPARLRLPRVAPSQAEAVCENDKWNGDRPQLGHPLVAPPRDDVGNTARQKSIPNPRVAVTLVDCERRGPLACPNRANTGSNDFVSCAWPALNRTANRIPRQFVTK